VIPEARADLRSDWPSACGGLSALQRPQPYVRVSATRAWVVNQVQNGRSASMRSMLPENRRHGQGQWPRRSARVNWELALAWARRLSADAIDLRGGRPARGGDYWGLRQRLLGASSPRRTRAGCFEPEIGARSSARVAGGLHWCEHRRVWTEDTADARKTGQIT